MPDDNHVDVHRRAHDALVDVAQVSLRDFNPDEVAERGWQHQLTRDTWPHPHVPGLTGGVRE